MCIRSHLILINDVPGAEYRLVQVWNKMYNIDTKNVLEKAEIV